MLLVVATIVNAGWGVLAIVSRNSLRTIPTAVVFDSFGQRGGGLIYLLTALLAAYGLSRPGGWGFLAGTPQNIFLLLAMWTALNAISRQHYADLVPRPWSFILTDQLLLVVMAPAHLVSLALYHGFAHGLQRGRPQEGASV
jgi:hypothetical protein